MNPLPQEASRCITAEEMRAIEVAAMAGECDEASLMQDAGTRLGHAIGRHFPRPGTAIAWPGKGHNGGDALIALRVLHDAYGWQIRIRHSFPEATLAPLTRRQLDLHRDTAAFDANDPTLHHPWLLLDGLLGIGADGSPLRGALADSAREMNDLRNCCGAITAAVDLPSGVHPDIGHFAENTVRADITFTLGAVKRGLIQPDAANAVGAISLVPVPRLAATSGSGPKLICPQYSPIPRLARPFDFHKGMAGRVSILAGSEAYLGAAVLCGSGAVAAGAGLVTLHIPHAIHALASAKCAPEVIVRPYQVVGELIACHSDSWVIGCGLGIEAGDALVEFITSLSSTPTVLDADALNAIAHNHATKKLGAHHLITPHPGEFRRLATDLADLQPLEAASAWTGRSPSTLLLKGCRSVIAARDKDIQINATGHPGMASAGMGDVLAGVAGALLARKLSLPDAAALAAWVCGRAAERAIHHQGESAETIHASSILDNLAGAFNDWHRAQR